MTPDFEEFRIVPRWGREEEAQVLWLQFSDLVPPEILNPFVMAVIYPEHPVDPHAGPGHPMSRVYVYSDDPYGSDELVILSLGTAIHEGRRETALQCAKTFGELEEMNDPLYRDIVDILSDRAEHPTVEDYESNDECWLEPPEYDAENDEKDYEKKYDALYEEYMVEVKKEYKELLPYGQRPPEDDDPFDVDEYYEWCFNYHPSGVFNPKLALERSVPGVIEEEFGNLQHGVWDGPYLGFKKKDKEAILEKFAGLGYTAVEDGYLISSNYFGGGSMKEFEKRVKFYDEMADILTKAGE